MAYHGGPQRHFQRAESATFFGREIGLMYMHAHLRYAQALAHVGDANGFFRALCQANPIGIRAVVPTASLRQANCYYSSSDAAFDDRYQASAEYDRIARGTIELDGGWRVYSSGAGIALGLIVRRFLGLSCESQVLGIDPVMPASLDGLRVETTLRGHRVEVVYHVQDPGHGVQAVQLNGKTVAFAREPNPYRPGAARVPWDALLPSLTAGNNVLTIGVGRQPVRSRLEPIVRQAGDVSAPAPEELLFDCDRPAESLRSAACRRIRPAATPVGQSAPGGSAARKLHVRMPG